MRKPLIPSCFQRLFLLVFACLGALACSSQSCDSLVGGWINQDSSIMHIISDVNGTLTGHYQSNASQDATLFSFVGLVNRNDAIPTLTFAISWGDYGSITSWTGYCSVEGDEAELTTMWHLVRPYVEYDWERFVTNTSTFKPM